MMKKNIYLFFLPFLLIQCLSLKNGADLDSDLTEIAKWTVNEGKLETATILEAEQAENTIKNIRETWTKINTILPKEYMTKYVKELELFTDGVEATLAGVKPIDDSNESWTYGIDPADLPVGNWKEKEDFLHTLIHEFGHILTLNNTQVEPSELEFQADETRYLTNEGLAKKDSYVNQFIKQFWYEEELLFEWDKIQETRNLDKKLDRLYDFYLAHKTKFHTDYAAESPEEDIAESWYYFVVLDKPTGQLIKDQKLLFFYGFPELILLRNEIRSAMK